MNTPSLSGNYVELIPMQLDHLPALKKAGEDPRIWEYMPGYSSAQDSAMEQFVLDALFQQKEGTTLPFSIVDKENENIIGSTRLYQFSPANRTVELGYTWYAPQYWGSPFNLECKFVMLQHCFESMQMLRVQIKTDARNIRAQKAIEKLAAKKEGTMRNERILLDGHIRDAVVYSIIDEDWKSVKPHLQSLLHSTASFASARVKPAIRSKVQRTE